MKTNTEETTRPLAERITQVALSRTYSSATIDEDAMPYREICSLTDSEFQSEQTEAHFELILEAFTVCQETGKTPRQLADEVSDLREQVKEHDACADAWCAKAKALNQERAELIAAVFAWWQEHQFDTTDGGTRNLYNDDPAFVTLAQRLQP